MPTEQTTLLPSKSTTTQEAPPPPFGSANVTKFRNAIGINTSSDLETASKKASKPRGIYKEIIQTQRRLSIQYHLISALHYIALIAQILIGATLATLGSTSRLHPTAIMVLGIINTSTAGVLALLKGQGLPDRLRKDEYEIQKVRDFIEEVDVRLALMGDVSEQEVEKLVEQIFEKYNSARDTAEMNRPSSYAHQVEAGVGGDATDEGGSKARGLLASNIGSVISDSVSRKGKGKFVIN